MKLIRHTAALAVALALAACSGGNSEQSNTANTAGGTELNNLENASDTLESVADNASGNTAEALTNQAEAVSNAAENASQAAENTTSNAH